MKLSRKAKRYDERILPGEFQEFETVSQSGETSEDRVECQLRREGGQVQLSQVVAERSTPNKLSFAKLQTKAEGLRQQIDYLKESLEIVDHDRRGMFIQLRSLPPYKDDEGIQFNEINIGRNKIVVQRISFSRKDEVKQQVPLELSEAELQRLLKDIRRAIA